MLWGSECLRFPCLLDVLEWRIVEAVWAEWVSLAIWSLLSKGNITLALLAPGSDGNLTRWSSESSCDSFEFDAAHAQNACHASQV